MTRISPSPDPTSAEPLPDNIRSVQPGGGCCYQIELLWGRWRRFWLTHLRPGYVARMRELRTGSDEGAPHEILDPRDLKYCHTLCTAGWAAKDDPFAWRDRIPLARWGLAETLLMVSPLLVITVATLAWGPGWWRSIAAVPAVLAGLVLYFFRDPPRVVPTDDGLVVAPADGKVVEITEIEDAFVGGRAVRIGIFLSIFNVHINRVPVAGRVLELAYRPGQFLNALNEASRELNESMWIGIEAADPAIGRYVVRQISGLIARRIVCAVGPGQQVDRGEQLGMIKLGSRTELILPWSEQLEIEVQVGQHVAAGETVFGRYVTST